MQEEATQRVREMQRRAQLTAQRAQEELDRKKANLPHFSAAGGAPAGKSRRAQRPSGAAAPANRLAPTAEKRKLTRIVLLF